MFTSNPARKRTHYQRHLSLLSLCCCLTWLLQVIINCGALPCLLQLLSTNHKKSIKKEACWTISNITAGTKEQIQAVIDAGIIPPLVHLLQVRRGHTWSGIRACRNNVVSMSHTFGYSLCTQCQKAARPSALPPVLTALHLSASQNH